MLRFLDAGESHGKCLLGIIEGLPAGLSLSEENINLNLKRRQGGYGRGERMKIEQDRVEVLSGLVEGKTIGSPLGLMIKNKDWENWQEKEYPPLTIPRPGHADFSGTIKYGFKDVRKGLLVQQAFQLLRDWSHQTNAICLTTTPRGCRHPQWHR